MPKILIIDDQFGRCGLGKQFKEYVDPRIFKSYKADRKNLCYNYGLIDITGDSNAIERNLGIAETIFCPGQKWNNTESKIENDLGQVLEFISNGWPFKKGNRWSLILLDLAFVQGELNHFGDPQERTMFGRDVILPRLKKEFGEDLPIVILSSTPKEENNPLIRKAGALDFIQRIPGAGTPPDEARKRLQDVLYHHGLLEDESGTIIGKSLSVLKMLRQARRAASAGKTMLLYGETGTGKNLLAQYIHTISERKQAPFEIFNASNCPANLQEDTLFGHWKGAFTDAKQEKAGMWERCNGGTVFIDEVACLDPSVQNKLMEPIESQKVRRLGHAPDGMQSIDIDVMTILATNRDPYYLKETGVLKQDFLNRISANVIDIPPLREHKEDIPDLVHHLSRSMFPDWHGTFYNQAIRKIRDHDWTEGNIRELRNVIFAAIKDNPGQDITQSDVHFFEKDIHNNRPSVDVLSHEQLWEEFTAVLLKNPEDMTQRERKLYRKKFNGVFTDLLAYILNWSLLLNNDATNTARFLSGCSEDIMDSSAAHQFLTKYLKLDTKRKNVLRKFLQYPASEQEIIKKIIEKFNGE
ncbi:MAG: sigma 54-interacting transcriptional regulator [candidate division KSB1 bacterium]|nr:sigma 54-interacting transcriptional regulator [candidate division KSB1 bacterium]